MNYVKNLNPLPSCGPLRYPKFGQFVQQDSWEHSITTWPSDPSFVAIRLIVQKRAALASWYDPVISMWNGLPSSVTPVLIVSSLFYPLLHIFCILSPFAMLSHFGSYDWSILSLIIHQLQSEPLLFQLHISDLSMAGCVATMPLGHQAFGFVQEWGMGPNSWPCWKENDVINLQIFEGTVYTPYFQIFEIHLGRTWKEEAKHGLLNAGHHPLAH